MGMPASQFKPYYGGGGGPADPDPLQNENLKKARVSAGELTGVEA